MSEQTGAPAAGAPAPITAPEAPAPQGEPAAQDTPLGPNGEKALKAERELRATADKKAADLQAQLDKIAQANMTELEKAQKEAQDARETATKATTEALRYRIAGAHGISTTPSEDGKPSDADLFLTGTDEASMTAQAERLAARASDTGNAPTFPRPDLTQGSGRDTANAASPAGDFAKFLNGQLSA